MKKFSLEMNLYQEEVEIEAENINEAKEKAKELFWCNLSYSLKHTKKDGSETIIDFAVD